MQRTAEISHDGVYRYQLGRRWRAGDHVVLWIMLNPSTADARKDDPTIKRCISFSQAWDADALVVVNLFALRATDPMELLAAPDPVGPENDYAIRQAVMQTQGWRVVCAWGTHGQMNGRSMQVGMMLRNVRRWRLGELTANQQPRHPLYLRAAQSITRHGA